MTRIARVIHRQIGGDAIQPGAEFGAGFVSFARAIDAQKNFLGQVFRSRRIVRHAIHKTHHRPAIFLHQAGESGIVTGLHPEHDFGVTLGFAECAGITSQSAARGSRQAEQTAIHRRQQCCSPLIEPLRRQKLRPAFSDPGPEVPSVLWATGNSRVLVRSAFGEIHRSAGEPRKSGTGGRELAYHAGWIRETGWFATI